MLDMTLSFDYLQELSCVILDEEPDEEQVDELDEDAML